MLRLSNEDPSSRPLASVGCRRGVPSECCTRAPIRNVSMSLALMWAMLTPLHLAMLLVAALYTAHRISVVAPRLHVYSGYHCIPYNWLNDGDRTLYRRILSTSVIH